jgi:hypothetical protein
MATKPGVNVEADSGIEKRIEKAANDAARAFRLGAGMPPESVPLIDDDALSAARRTLLARAPAHFERRLNAYVSHASRSYAAAILNEIGEEADRIKRVMGGSQYPDDRKLDAAARAQDLADLATRTYSRSAAYMTSRDNGGYDAIQDAAKAARRWALTTYAQRAARGDNEWQRFADDGAVARAVLGTLLTARIRDALAAGDILVPTFKGINTYAAAVLGHAGADAPFGPPIVVGYTYPRVESSRYGTPQAVARAQMYAILHTPTGNAILRDSENRDDAFLAKIKAGGFDMENDERSRYGEVPALILKTHLGGSYGYGGQTAARVLVPVGDYTIRHVSRDDVGTGRAFEDYLDALTRDHGYRYSYGSKKDAVGREIGRAKSGGGVKWIEPDPFAPSKRG